MAGTVEGGRLSRVAARFWWAPVVGAGVIADRGSRTRWLVTPGVVALAASASTLAKLAIRRPRPKVTMRAAPVGRLGAASLPSTHATCAFAIAAWQRGSRQGWWLHLVAMAISCWRVRNGAHHRADVIAGAVLGYGISLRLDALEARR